MKPCVLVVDDDPDIRVLLCKALEADYKTLSAVNGYQAVATITKGNPQVDLVVTDIKMPGLNGIEFWDYLPERVAEKMPVIVISGYLDLPNHKTAMKSLQPGAVLAKPVDICSLRETVHHLICQSPAPVHKNRILIVDDDEYVRAPLKKMLEIAGYEVDEASGGQQGLEIFQANSPDLVLTDICMPGMNGVDFIAALKEKKENVKIIAITGFDTFLESGGVDVDYVLIKPPIFRELIDCVKTVLENNS